MALQYLFEPNKQFQSLGGVNEVGGFLRVFLNGTDDRATTYKNFDGTLNEADIVLDTYGRAVVIVDDSKTYRIEVYNRLGGLMWTVSNYKAQGGGGGGSGTPVSVEGTAGEIEVDENEVGGVKHFVVGLAATIKNAISSLTSAVNGLALSLGNKKERQTPKEFLGSTTKTVVRVSQNEDGEMSVSFGDIDFQGSEVVIDESYDLASVLALIDAKKFPVLKKQGNLYRLSNISNSFVTFSSTITIYYGAAHKLHSSLEINKISSSGWSNEIKINVPVDLVTSSISPSSPSEIPNSCAVLNYVNNAVSSAVSGLGGKQITNNGVPFPNVSTLPTTTPYYGQNIVSNDYAFVQGSTYVTRYLAYVSGTSVTWSESFTIDTSSLITVPINFVEAQSVENINANETLPTILGKIKKWFTDKISQLGALAFLDQVGNAEINGTINDSHIDSASTWNAKQDAISDLDEIRSGAAAGATALQPSGDGSNVTSTFTTAGSRTNISTGEKLSVIFGKIAKWFGDLKALAFRDTVGTAQLDNDSVTAAKVKDNETLPVHISGTAESSKRFNDEVGTSGVDGHRAIFGGIDSGNNVKIAMSERTGGVSKATEITPSGISTTGGMIIGGNIIIGGSNPATDVKDNSNLAVLIASKANKASSGNGNLAVIDANGNYDSSGIGAYAQSQLNSAVTNSIIPWLLDNSYIVTHSFWIQTNTSVVGRAVEFVNSYTGENLLRISVAYDYVNGRISFILPWSNVSWNGWIIENPDPQSTAEVGGAIITANGTKHSSNSSSSTVTPFYIHTEETIHSNNVSQTTIGTFDVGKSTMYDTSSYYDFVITLFNGLSSKRVILKISMAIDRYVSGSGTTANIIGMATIDASGLNI